MKAQAQQQESFARGEVLAAWLRASVLNFTRYFFQVRYGRPYIVGQHHIAICDALDRVLNGQTHKLIINIAPRYGKTELVSKNFIAAGFALNPQSRFIHLSYSDDLVRSNSDDVRAIMNTPEYIHLFGTHAAGLSAKDWKTPQGGEMYAVASGGQLTGFGAGLVEAEETPLDESAFARGDTGHFCGAIVIDDPLKPDDALSDALREKVNQKFETTIRNRTNSRNTPIIVIGQRLHENDLCGYLMKTEPNEWEVLSLPCVTEDGNALWPFKHTLAELHRLEEINAFVYQTQYQQNPRPKEGLMYTRFRTYDTLPVGTFKRKNYTDTADEGSDFLCSICYNEYPWGDCYVTDVLYTDKPMEYTEPETARMLDRNETQTANIESNNGGRGFARNVERGLREMGNRTTSVLWFSQTQNKQARIFTRSADVQNSVFFPTGWETMWPRFYNALAGYRKQGRNAHDDAPDALTGVVEKRTPQGGRGKFATV